MQAATVFRVHIGTVTAWRERYRQIGNVERKVRRPINKKIILEKLIEYVEAPPSFTSKKRKYSASARRQC